MKRIVSILLCLTLLFTFVCGCSKTQTDGNSSEKEVVNSQNDISSKEDVLDDATSSEDITNEDSSKEDVLGDAASKEDITSEDNSKGNSSNEDTVSDEEFEYIYEDEEDEETEALSVPATTKKTFKTLPSEHTSLLRSNPDRGWRSEEIYNVSADLDALKSETYESIYDELEAEINGNTLMEKVTISRVYFYMYEYRNMKTIPQETVDYIERVLRAYKELGVKVYLEFYYQREQEGAKADIILSHLDTYGKIFENNQDTIYAVCFGLIGRYGEWVATKPEIKNKDRQAITDKLLSVLPESIYLTMRYPDLKKTFVSASHPRYKTIGYAQDAFFGKMFPYEDKGQGTWRPASDNWQWQMSIKESPYGVMDAELFTTNWFRNDAGGLYVEPYSSIEALSELHMTTLSVEHGYGDINRFGGDVKETVLYNWKCEKITAEKLKELGVLCTPTYFTDRNGDEAERNCFEYVRDYLGYHLSATDLNVSGGTKKGEKITVSMNLKNYGFSAAFNLKSGFAILDENNKVVSEIEVGDPTSWHSTDPENYSDRTQLKHNLTAQMKLPEKSGTYKLAFFLRNNLGQTARLDNTIEYSNGFNILHMFTINENSWSDASKDEDVESVTESTLSDVTSKSEKTEPLESEEITVNTTTSLPSVKEMIQDMKGLNVLALGDSLFRGTSPEPLGEQVWINRLAVQCDWNITNLGWGGMTVSFTNANKIGNAESMYDKLFNTNDFVYGTKNSSFYSYGNTNKSAEEVDVIFLEGGCNDYNAKNNVALGGVDSNTNDTFLGAWNLIARKLMEDYPNAVIVFLTTWELDLNTRSDKVSSLAYSTSIKTLYENNYSFKKNVTLIDMGNPDVSGAYMKDGDWRSKYAFDRYHLNAEGMKLVGDNMLPHIWKALKETQVI